MPWVLAPVLMGEPLVVQRVLRALEGLDLSADSVAQILIHLL